MIEICLQYDNMHIFGMINAFNYINNHVISSINSMLSEIKAIDLSRHLPSRVSQSHCVLHSFPHLRSI